MATFVLHLHFFDAAITCFGRLACICPALLRRRRSYRASMAPFHPGCRFDALRAPLVSPEGSSSSRSRQRQCARRATASARCSSRPRRARTSRGFSRGPGYPAPSPRCLLPTTRRHKVRGRAQVAVSAVRLMAKPVKYTCTSTSGPLLGPAAPANIDVRTRGNEARSNLASGSSSRRSILVVSPRPPRLAAQQMAGLGGPPGPEPALGHQPSAQRPPLGWWAWWGWLEGVEPPVTGLYGAGGEIRGGGYMDVVASSVAS